MVTELEKCEREKFQATYRFTRRRTKIRDAIKKKVGIKKIIKYSDELAELLSKCLATIEQYRYLSLRTNNSVDKTSAIMKNCNGWREKYANIYEETQIDIKRYQRRLKDEAMIRELKKDLKEKNKGQNANQIIPVEEQPQQSVNETTMMKGNLENKKIKRQKTNKQSSPVNKNSQHVHKQRKEFVLPSNLFIWTS